MTVYFSSNMNYKPVARFKIKPYDFVYNFDPKIHEKEYIALPWQKEPQFTFQRAMKLTIILGQMFGLNPVLGITENNASKVRFTYYSGRCVYSILSIIGQSFLVCFSILKIFWETNASLNSNSTVIFFGSNCLITVLFFRLAKNWPRLSRQIAKIESVDPNTDRTLVKKCNITCAVVLLLGTLEHGLSELSGVSVAMACHPDKQPYDGHLLSDFYWVWVYIPYNTFVGLIVKFFNIQCTFNWNYSDAFIMCICVYLTARLQQINDRLNAVRGQPVTETFLRTMREDYTKATSLVRQVDQEVNTIIFISFASNLFSMCFLILHTLEEGIQPFEVCEVSSHKRLLGGYEHAIYLITAIGFLIGRSLAMSLLAARVNSVASEPAFALYEVPSGSFNVEVQRFLDQVHSDSVVLSGLQFFSIKRGMVLTIAATIVTYELVLIQFSGVDTSSPSSSK